MLKTTAIALALALTALPAFAQDQASPPPAGIDQSTDQSTSQSTGQATGQMPQGHRMHGPMTPQMQAAREQMRQACATDAQTLCSGMAEGGGRIARCLRDHADQLSAGCKTAWQNLKAAHQAAMGGQQPAQQ